MTNFYDIIAKTGQNPPPPTPTKGDLKPGSGKGAGPITVHTGGSIEQHYRSEYLPGQDRTLDK